MTVSLHNRRKLQEAMRRLLDGSATTADGKLTWKNVAAVSGVSKATADRAVDLRDEFRLQVQQRTPVPSARTDPISHPRDELEQELAHRQYLLGSKQPRRREAQRLGRACGRA